MPPCSAMPCRSGAAKVNFLDLLRPTRKFPPIFSADELQTLFDLGYHTKHVDTIFKRVFSNSLQKPH